jgi:predicted dehydrogenase
MGVASQMGNQGTASDGLRRGVEYIQAGVIGQVREAHVWTNRPVWPQAPQVTSRPKPTPVPPHVHWDLFLGPAPFRPYNGDIQSNKHPTYHDFNWRGWWDFGTGALGDMACHTANLTFMALKLGYPTSVVAECGELNPETYPAWAHVTFEFPARDDMAPVTFHWYEGKKDGVLVHPPQELLAKLLKKGQKLAGSGSILVGDKGILFSPNDYGESWTLFPEEQFKDFRDPDPSLPRNGKGDNGMKAEWVAAIKGGMPALSNFDYAAMLTETILLGNVAMRAQKKLMWDGPNMKFTNAPEAEKFLHREYREGWKL